MLLWAGIQIAIATGFAALGFWQLFYGEGVLLPGLFTAAFLVMFVSSVLGTFEQFKVRVLPYFEKPLGDVDTFMTGKSLLWHTRDLDELAQFLSVRPLSAFASGDDLIVGEEVQFNDPREALPTVGILLARSKKSRFPKELISDLTKLHEALQSASQKNVRFCLVLREGARASGHEMAHRQGSFF